jgi:ABC-2 type transport system permease protein
MSPAHTVRLIATREVTDRLRSKVYVLGTLGIVVVVVAGILVGGLRDGGPTRVELGVVGETPPSFPDLLAASTAGQNMEVEIIEVADRGAAADAIADGELHAVLLDGAELMVEGAPSMGVVAAVEAALQQAETVDRLESAGLSPEEIAAAASPRSPLAIVDPAGEAADMIGGPLIAFAATILLFVAVTLNASSLLTGAVEEKSTHVIELLLGSVRPWQLLAGKISALTGLALAQVGIVVVAALGANALVDAFALPPATTATVVVSLLMLVIGFVFYAALYTVAGSLASTTEDAQGSSGPLGFLLMGAYFVVIFAVLPNPQGAWAHVLTYLPPTAALTVPARVALDAIPLWQVLLAAGVTVLGVVLTVALAARLYAASLLAGGKLTWRQAWRTEPIR